MPSSENSEPIDASAATPADSSQANARLHFEQGWLALSAGDWASAAAEFTRVTLLAPAVEVGHFNLGNALFELKRFREAAAAYQRAFELEPSRGTLNNLGNAWAAAGEINEAIRCYRQALQTTDEPAENAHAESAVEQSESLVCNLGQAFESSGRWQEAAEVYLQAVQAFPGRPTLIKRALRGCLWQTAAEPIRDLLQAAKELTEKDDELHLLAAAAHERLGDISLALRNLLEANALSPDNPKILARLAEHQLFRGRHAEASMCLHRALTLGRPSASLHSLWLATSLYHPQATDEKFREEASRWATIHSAGSVKNALPGKSLRFPIRLGIVLTPDAEPFSIQCLTACVHHLDEQQVTVHCYSDWIREDDEMLVQLQQAVTARGNGHWHRTAHRSDDQLRQLIQSERIDCLVDLSGHGAHTRLLVFAKRAAPRQLAWSSVPATSGLETMDGIFADEITVPQSKRDAFTEKRCGLEPPFCFLLPSEVKAFTERIKRWEPSADASDRIVLGGLCPPSRLTPSVVSTWSEILLAQPKARLLLADEALNDASLRQEILERFLQAGVGDQQLEMRSITCERDRYTILDEIAMVLDPFPRNQPLAVCQALFMGVPVLCMASPVFCGRISASVLHHLHLDDYVAHSVAEYRELAIAKIQAIAQQSTPTAQRQARQQLHQQMATSKLCDAADFAKRITLGG